MPRLITTLLFLLMCSQISFGQDTTEEKTSDRIFMPSIQIGYLNNRTDQLSGGVFIQTSIEYQSPKGLFFRINYDDYDSDYDLSETQSALGAIKGRVAFTEILGGLGFRRTKEKHNVLIAIQSGIRLYSFPLLSFEDNNILLELDNRNILINRYTLGYEYEIDTKAFLSLELFTSHVLEKQDYWEENALAIGFTVGITATIF